MLRCRWIFVQFKSEGSLGAGEPGAHALPFCFILPLGTIIFWCLELYNPLPVELSLCIHVSVQASSLVLWEEKIFLSKGTQIQPWGPHAGKSFVNNFLALKVLNINRNVCGIRASGCVFNYLPVPRGSSVFQYFIPAGQRGEHCPGFVLTDPGLYEGLPKCPPV